MAKVEKVENPPMKPVNIPTRNAELIVSRSSVPSNKNPS